jgi:hypothetical protein
MTRLLFLTLFSLFAMQSQAQVDRTFWFAAPDASAGHGESPILIRVATLATAATVTISMPANGGFTPIVLNVPANSVVSQDLTAFLAQIETPFDAGGVPVARTTGILIESTADITAYYELNAGNNPDIFALKGLSALGTNFYLPTQRSWNHQTGLSPAGRTGFLVVATVDGTVVTIRPTVALEGGRAANTTYTVTLNRGQSYCGSVSEPLAGGSPTGTRITSTQPITVSMFHDSINSVAGGCYDMSGDQLVPVNILGMQYSIQRGFLDESEQVVIVATQNGTVVTITNVTNATPLVVNLNAGQFHILSLPVADPFTFINSTANIYVAHYAGFGCEQGAALIPPVNCSGSRTTRFIRSTDEYCGITLMTRNGNQDNFSFNGGAENTTIPASAFTVVPGSGGVWYSARIALTTAQVASGAAATVTNSAGLFHLGLINGAAVGSGVRYGYFSNFNSLNLGPDIIISYGSTVTLDAGPNGFSYLWNTGATTRTITVGVGSSANYSVTVDVGNACLLTDEICVGTNEYVWTGYVDSDYNNAANWSRPCTAVGPPNCNIDVVIPIPANLLGAKANVNITTAGLTSACRDLWIEEAGGTSGILQIAANARFNVCRNFRHEGTLAMAPTNSTLAFIGTVPQTYSRKTATAVGEFERLIISNTTTATTNAQWSRVTVKDGTGLGNMIVSPTGALIFENGYLETENLREVVVRNRATNAVSGHAANRFVAGRIRRHMNTTGSYDYPVGLALNSGNPVVDATKTGTLTNMDPATDWVVANYCPTGIGNTRVLDFDGVDDFIQMPATLSPNGNQSRTIEMWARVRRFSGTGGLFQFGRDANGIRDFSLRVNGANDDWSLRLSQTVANNYNFSTSALNSGAGLLNTWHHYAVTYDGTQVCIYINGTLVNTCQTRNLNTALDNNFLARWTSGFLNGQIDEVRIWNTARTQAQISSNRCTKISPCTAGLIAYYDFEEGTGTSITHKTEVCTPPTMTYQLANVNFGTATNADNLLAFFTKYGTVPTLSGQPLSCGANFNCQTLDNGFWTINAFNASGTQIAGTGTYEMTLYNRDYTNGTAPCISGIGDRGTVMRRANSAAAWGLAGGFCTNQLFTSTGRGGMTGFSDFATARTFMPVILPVELVSFTATYKGSNKVQTLWETITEQNVEKFIVERSTDGFNFTPIGTEKAVGNSTTRNQYSLTDFNARIGINYYRLKTLDFDGKFSYSKIVAVKIDSENGLNNNFDIYPNPAPNGGNLTITGVEAGNIHIQITNTLGQVVFEKNIAHQKQTLTVSPKLATGVYVVHVFTETNNYYKKLVLE